MEKDISPENESISALERGLKMLGKEAVDKIISDIEAKNVDSPTIEEYFDNFNNFNKK